MEKLRRPLVGIGIVIYNQNDQILLGRRIGSHGAGDWSLPGGHLEWRESFQECCSREVLEETGIEIGEVEPIHFSNSLFNKEDLHYVTLFFSVYVDVDVQPQNMEPDKCEGWKWFSTTEPLPRPLFGSLEELFDKLY